MKYCKSLIFFLFFSACCFITYSQNTDELLANQYYQNKEYDKAAIYYEKLFNSTNNLNYYDYYLNCLLEIKDFKKAEKAVRRLIKQNPNELSFLVDLGKVYKKNEEPEKANKEYEKAIKQLTADQEQIIILAEAFIRGKEWDYAIQAYLKGRKILSGLYPFHFELAEVYYEKGDTRAMINEYLDVLEISDSFIQSVQNALQTTFGSDAEKKNDILKAEVIKRIQDNSDKLIFSELLIWMQIQQKDFEGAFIQIKALDKRTRGDGTRMMNFAQACIQNEAYDIAVKAYEYVILKGAGSYYYAFAKMELLNTLYKKITVYGNYSFADLSNLEKNYQFAVAELGKSLTTIPLLKNLAHLQAFYLNKPGEALALLEEVVTMVGISAKMQADCKLELGDILLMTGDIWEASLIYSQVEKAFKYDPIGQEAKFRNAKVSYYTGDFNWAKAQLDILKGATSKLIANDAMALSLIISDNTAIDTSTAPLLLFARSELLSFQNKDSLAIQLLDSLSAIYPSHALSDDILYKKAAIMVRKNKYNEAADYFNQLLVKHSGDILADDTLYKLAELNELKLNNPEKAKELYQKLLIDFPGSLFTLEARKRFRKLRGDTVN